MRNSNDGTENIISFREGAGRLHVHHTPCFSYLTASKEKKKTHDQTAHVDTDTVQRVSENVLRHFCFTAYMKINRKVVVCGLAWFLRETSGLPDNHRRGWVLNNSRILNISQSTECIR